MCCGTYFSRKLWLRPLILIVITNKKMQLSRARGEGVRGGFVLCESISQMVKCALKAECYFGSNIKRNKLPQFKWNMEAIATCLLTNGENPGFNYFILNINWTHLQFMQEIPGWDELLCAALHGFVVYSDDGNIWCVLAKCHACACSKTLIYKSVWWKITHWFLNIGVQMQHWWPST